MQRRPFIGPLCGAILLLACPMLGFAARGEEINALYQATYAGLPAGEARFSFTGDGGSYRGRNAVESAELPRLVTHFRGTAEGEGRLEGVGNASPPRYEALYDLRKRHDS